MYVRTGIPGCIYFVYDVCASTDESIGSRSRVLLLFVVVCGCM